MKINSVSLWKTISGLNLSPLVHSEYRCSMRSQNALPTKTWAIYLFIKWNWNERNEICIYITPFIYRGYESTLQTLHRYHFTTDEEWAPLDWKMEALQACISGLDSKTTSLLLPNQNYLDLPNNQIKLTTWRSLEGFFITCTMLLHKNSVWKGSPLTMPGRYKLITLAKKAFLPADGAGVQLKQR